MVSICHLHNNLCSLPVHFRPCIRCHHVPVVLEIFQPVKILKFFRCTQVLHFQTFLLLTSLQNIFLYVCSRRNVKTLPSLFKSGYHNIKLIQVEGFHLCFTLDNFNLVIIDTHHMSIGFIYNEIFGTKSTFLEREFPVQTPHYCLWSSC